MEEDEGGRNRVGSRFGAEYPPGGSASPGGVGKWGDGDEGEYGGRREEHGGEERGRERITPLEARRKEESRQWPEVIPLLVPE
jgi:hypothetical protein